MLSHPRFAAVAAIFLGLGVLIATFFPPIVIAIMIAIIIIILGLLFFKC